MSDNIDLDDLQTYRRLDPQGMLTHIRNLPVLCRQAWQLIMAFPLTGDYSRVNKVVVLGMGGSAIGGDLVSSLTMVESEVPILVCRDYDLPRYVDEQTLVIASSYSGVTEETLSAFQQALKTRSQKLAITTGGKLKEMAEKEKIPVITFNYLSQPRAALPFSFLTILGLVQKLGFIKDKSGDIDETVSVLNKLSNKINETIPTPHNPAKQLAQKLYGLLPVIYGAGFLSEVARRWKTQINENSKSTAFYEVFSELNHNSVVGYTLPEEVTRQTMVVFLHSNLLNQPILSRYEITGRLLEQAGIYYHTVTGEGRSALCQMTGMILFGDYVSYYLAMLNDVDPTPVKAIDYLKSQLARNRE